MRKTLLFVALFAIIFLTVGCQANKTFDCGLFTLEYPNEFNPVPIQNSPHMVFKAVSDNYYLTASYWDYGLDDSVNIWDNQVYEQYKQMPVPDGAIVEITRETIKIKNEQVRCLMVKTIERPQWFDGEVGLVYYLLIHDGYLFTFAVGSNANTYSVGSATPFPDKLMGGLKFKITSKKDASVSYERSISGVKTVDCSKTNSTEKKNKQIHDELEKSVRDYNRELPEDIGYGMTMTRCALEGHSMVYTIRWEGLSPSDFSAEDIKELKKNMIEGLHEEMNNTISRYMLISMSDNGYDFIYRLINEKGEILCSIRISPCEI